MKFLAETIPVFATLITILASASQNIKLHGMQFKNCKNITTYVACSQHNINFSVTMTLVVMRENLKKQITRETTKIVIRPDKLLFYNWDNSPWLLY